MLRLAILTGMLAPRGARVMRRIGFTAFFLCAGCSAETAVPLSPAVTWEDRGLSLSVLDTTLQARGELGWGIRARIENHSGRTLQMGPPGCRGLETLRHGQWLAYVPPEAISCVAWKLVLEDGQSYAYTFSVPVAAGEYRNVIGAYTSDNQDYLVRSAPVHVP